MKKPTIRSHKRSKSNRVRERTIADLIGSVDGLPTDLSARKKHYLRTGYGRKRSS